MLSKNAKYSFPKTSSIKFKGIVMSFHKKNQKKNCDCNLSCIKLYIRVAIL